MANLAAHVRLRPIRFGFLVKPDDVSSLLEVFRVNTCRRELTLGADQKVEADFVLWYQRKALMSDSQDSPTDIVFGEAKSFGRDAFNTTLSPSQRRIPLEVGD